MEPATTAPKGWDKLFDFMLSGSPGSFVLWAILAYGIWATILTNWQDHDGGMPWHRKDPDAAPRKWFDWRRRD